MRQECVANHWRNGERRATASIGLTLSGRLQRQASKATEVLVPDSERPISQAEDSFGGPWMHNQRRGW
ncbi:hypothetical protein K505DRAFT_51250 [Melanomma pulvis-pyrius CBS 109.77]|uniref:Uncharacterized protein n=1 Tax=Melanomma pulvis-pyrius CBS 109.77 TaxID=1314802 RepID=A0A6A6X8F1_9PLEO|nr:hypothetical protein K505DRAFT_51250 [Melanomma pulvis-pyrius CBS 109.77]